MKGREHERESMIDERIWEGEKERVLERETRDSEQESMTWRKTLWERDHTVGNNCLWVSDGEWNVLLAIIAQV